MQYRQRQAGLVVQQEGMMGQLTATLQLHLCRGSGGMVQVKGKYGQRDGVVGR